MKEIRVGGTDLYRRIPEIKINPLSNKQKQPNKRLNDDIYNSCIASPPPPPPHPHLPTVTLLLHKTLHDCTCNGGSSFPQGSYIQLRQLLSPLQLQKICKIVNLGPLNKILFQNTISSTVITPGSLYSQVNGDPGPHITGRMEDPGSAFSWDKSA